MFASGNRRSKRVRVTHFPADWEVGHHTHCYEEWMSCAVQNRGSTQLHTHMDREKYHQPGPCQVLCQELYSQWV